MIIGISGKIGSGKDTIGQIIQYLTDTTLNKNKNFSDWLDDTKHLFEHESEIALDDYKFDYTIDNNGTIPELIVKVKSILLNENLI